MSDNMTTGDRATRAGFVALIGAPNAGKSTLVNALTGTKVSIVTHKVQTTRALIRGIFVEGDAQIVLVDTPGIFSPKRHLERAMVKTAWRGASDADRVAVIIDAKGGITEEVADILERAGKVAQPKDLVLNKIDLVPREKLLELAQKANEICAFEQTYMVSATKGSGLEDLKRGLASKMPSGPWFYPEDQVSDLPMRALAAEITREKLILRLHEELPYRSSVETTQWKSLRDGSVRIEQTIYVERESQRKIVLGEKGRTIKAIGASARTEIAEAAETPVHLFLFVKVRENWSQDPERYREIGLDFSDG
ncbi:MAG: GTPase Era [Tepidamorphaceae bacterium]|nr:GTPase Era [Rhodobiaceae bacterium]MCC0048719.1 GTPase Era [Rhodobiaceae bacterium]